MMFQLGIEPTVCQYTQESRWLGLQNDSDYITYIIQQSNTS